MTTSTRGGSPAPDPALSDGNGDAELLELGKRFVEAVDAWCRSERKGDEKRRQAIRHTFDIKDEILRRRATTLAGMLLKVDAFLFGAGGVGGADDHEHIDKRIAEYEAPSEGDPKWTAWEHFTFTISRDILALAAQHGIRPEASMRMTEHCDAQERKAEERRQKRAEAGKR
jgi:hypothetical protein